MLAEHAFKPSTWRQEKQEKQERQEAKAGSSLVSLKPGGLQSEYQDTQSYQEKPCLELKLKPKQKNYHMLLYIYCNSLEENKSK